MDHEMRRHLEEIHEQKKAQQEAAKPKPLPAMTRAQRLSREKVFRYFAEERLSDQSVLDYTLRDEVPEAWHTLEYDLDVWEPKVKVTLWLDKSVAQFYRGIPSTPFRLLALLSVRLTFPTGSGRKRQRCES